MEIRNLITFVHVAELNSFTKAAQMLDYSQSTISFQIKQLETELDCLLFERINHTLILTDRGRELLDYAHKISQLTDEFRQQLNEDQEVSGDVHIVSPDSLCEAMLLQNFAEFYSRYPNIRLKFSTADTVDMFRMLDRNEADIMLTLDSHVYQKDYVIAKECQMSTHFVVGEASPLAQRSAISIEELVQHPFILTEKGMGYRGVLDKHLERQSLDIQPILEISRTDIITRLLENGTAVSFLPDFVTRRGVDQGKLRYLRVEGFEIDPIWQQLIYHKNKWISRALGTFIDYVTEHEFHRS
jgi:DNA-binding transcriptional LysR family regulator